MLFKVSFDLLVWLMCRESAGQSWRAKTRIPFPFLGIRIRKEKKSVLMAIEAVLAYLILNSPEVYRSKFCLLRDF